MISLLLRRKLIPNESVCCLILTSGKMILPKNFQMQFFCSVEYYCGKYFKYFFAGFVQSIRVTFPLYYPDTLANKMIPEQKNSVSFLDQEWFTSLHQRCNSKSFFIWIRNYIFSYLPQVYLQTLFSHIYLRLDYPDSGCFIEGSVFGKFSFFFY